MEGETEKEMEEGTEGETDSPPDDVRPWTRPRLVGVLSWGCAGVPRAAEAAISWQTCLTGRDVTAYDAAVKLMTSETVKTDIYCYIKRYLLAVVPFVFRGF